MAYHDLLVQIDATRACAQRIDATVGLAARLGAHLSGLYLVPELIGASFSDGYLPAEVQAEIARTANERAGEALAKFCAAAERAGVRFDQRMEPGLTPDFAELLGLHGRHADLIIMGQPDSDDEGFGPPPELVVLGSGRPVLIVPYIGAPPEFGRKVAVAWSATRESARAVADAMPLLERADSVSVVTVNPKRGGFGHGEQPGADIALHLARHGIDVQVERVEGTSVDPGNAILSHLADSGADLLVMGGYGHSRLRELVVGGVTRTILKSMIVPVLMAH